MNWLDRQVSLYKTHSDNYGRPSTFRNVILTESLSNWNTIWALRQLDSFQLSEADYNNEKTRLKSSLQCFTPAALMQSKAKGNVQVIQRSGILQFDFDEKDIKQYDIEELKQAVFDLPFIGFCGKSCSGKGLYALALIAERDRLTEYADHCFAVFQRYGVNPDTSKGSKPQDLRYVSWDENMLMRDSPEELYIKNFSSKYHVQKKEPDTKGRPSSNLSYNLINNQLKQVAIVQKGSRWETVQRVSFTLGGNRIIPLLGQIKNAIRNNPAFVGEEEKYCKCADDCFEAGLKKPFAS